jgi:hypothetical protein
VAQIWRFPGVPHADGIWHVWPPPWQHAIPVAQSVEVAQTKAVPPGHAVPIWQELEPPPSAALVQHTWAAAQSVGAAQICGLPAGHAVPAWHAFAPPPAPPQHT